MARMKGTSDYYAVKVLSKAFIKKVDTGFWANS